MSFVSYLHLILLISSQTLLVTVALKNFWKLNGLLSKPNFSPTVPQIFFIRDIVCYKGVEKHQTRVTL